MSDSHPPLTETELLVIRLVDSGYARWRIAELVGLPATTIRAMIRALCERFDCAMVDLPAAVDEDDLYPYISGPNRSAD